MKVLTLLLSDFYDTAVTDNDWVCDLGAHPTDLFTFGTAGLVFGTAFFSYLADWTGRKPAFIMSVLISTVFPLTKIFVSHNYLLYAVVKIISFTSMFSLYQCPWNILAEMSPVDQRGNVTGMAFTFWAIGQVLVPFMGWSLAR